MSTSDDASHSAIDASHSATVPRSIRQRVQSTLVGGLETETLFAAAMDDAYDYSVLGDATPTTCTRR